MTEDKTRTRLRVLATLIVDKSGEESDGQWLEMEMPELSNKSVVRFAAHKVKYDGKTSSVLRTHAGRNMAHAGRKMVQTPLHINDEVEYERLKK